MNTWSGTALLGMPRKGRAPEFGRWAPIRAIAGLPLLLACALSHAGVDALPAHPFEALTWPATLAQKPNTGARLGGFQLEFEKTTLSEVLTQARVGSIHHAGDAGESAYWLCYTLGGASPARLWITTHGEMGGSERAITGITVTAIKSNRPTRACPAAPTHLQPVSLRVPVWVGSNEDSMKKALGTPSHRSGDCVSYDFAGKGPGNCLGGFDVSNSLVLKLRRGVVKVIHAHQVTSC